MSMITTRRLSLHRRTAPPAHDAGAIVSPALGPVAAADGHRGSDPLLCNALAAFYDAGDTLHVLRRSHCPDPAGCELCEDARLAWAALQPLECGLEGEVYFPDVPQLAQRREVSERCRAAGRPRSPRRPRRSPSRRNHPVHELAVLALIQLGEALEALRDDRRARGDEDSYVSLTAEVAAYLVPLVTADLESNLVPTAALLLRRGVDQTPDRANILRLLEATAGGNE